jgi:hypothetical protein
MMLAVCFEVAMTSLLVGVTTRPTAMPRATVAAIGLEKTVDVKHVADALSFHDSREERLSFLVGHDASERVTAVAAGTTMMSTVQLAKDAKLAHDDTRRWCLDRCLATGHCDAVEDLLSMSTLEVKEFCNECADLEECELLADENENETTAEADDETVVVVPSAAWQTVHDRYHAATVADGASGCIG